jgi:sulfopyruvate decarboxylase TPP-binding subunit
VGLFLFGILIVLEKLELVSNPVAMILVGNVHILNSNFVTVSCLKSFNKLTKLPFLFMCCNTTHIGNVNIEMSIQVGLGKTIEFVIKQLTHTFIRKFETSTYVFIIVNSIKL